MIKFVETEVVFSEIPDEVTLAINISNCQNNCKGCHSAYLRDNIGDELTLRQLENLISQNDGITCICFMGEGNDPKALHELILFVKENFKGLKIGLYSGRENVDDDFYWENLDYLKIGPYIEEYGPLNSETTNQRLYKKIGGTRGTLILNDIARPYWYDITDKFWKKKV